MSVKNITAKCNLDTGTWTIDKSLLKHVSNQIAIGFENNAGNTVTFNNLSFLFRITEDGSTIVEKSYPPSGITYEETNDAFISIDMLNELIPGHEYSLYLSVTNNSQSYTETVTLNIPYPEKPFSSWTWSEENREYEPPVSYPNSEDDRGYLWAWDETNGKWVKRSGEMLRGLFVQKLSQISLNDSTTALSKAETMFNNGDYTLNARLVWQYATVFVRNDINFNVWANEVGLTESQLDTVFA
tara:strand:+ start:146 stop:871 length:726 start_codon:yes stop_codon:yes gene_type:complete